MGGRVLILGGGPSALTCAWHLTEADPDLDITVLQLGWRCGGKGASGRQLDDHNRVLEHGLHIMFGFYDNFFAMIEKAYDELDRPEGAPLRTWEEAFVPFDSGVCMDFWEGVWYPVSLTFARNRSVPGHGTAINGTEDTLALLLGAGIQVAFGWRALEDLNDLLFGDEIGEGIIPPDPVTGTIDSVVRHAMKVLQRVLVVGYDVSQAIEKRGGIVLDLLRGLENVLMGFLDRIANHSHATHLLVEGIAFLVALVTGVVSDGVLLRGGYDAIDDRDFADWLVENGMNPAYRDSVAVRFLYDAAFSYRRGDAEEPAIAAGVAVRTLLRMGLTYKGAAYYKMASGMGDVIIAPMVQALKKRGVRFGFFQKVEEVVPHPTGAWIEKVRVRVQARPKAGKWNYEPLFDADGLPAWPSTPLYDQLENADALKGIDLESYYATYPTDDFEEYVFGRDFDQVVLATPTPCLPFIAPQLIDRCQRWRDMVENVQGAPTMALQVWFTPTLSELGWDGPESPLLSLYVDPLNTWSDMSQTLWSESWPKGAGPGSVAYFCGAQESPGTLPPLPADDPTYPERMLEAAKAASLEMIENHMGPLFPNAILPDGSFDWSLTVDPEGRTGAERLVAQFVKSNCEPPEWCTLALPNTNQFRMKADETCFHNLTVCGDWIDNNFYVACLEGAVMGGILAARAVSGKPIPIIGELADQGFPVGRPDLLKAPHPPSAASRATRRSRSPSSGAGSARSARSGACSPPRMPTASTSPSTNTAGAWAARGRPAAGSTTATRSSSTACTSSAGCTRTRSR
jgi:uncharacterized protein with NAD-binding domain and iron-sulfur cluster